MTNCPYSNQMLRHVRDYQVYWFCRRCPSEMLLVEQQSLSFVTPALERHLAPLGLGRSLVTV